MKGMECAIGIEMLVFFRREEYKALFAFEEAIEVVMKVVVLLRYDRIVRKGGVSAEEVHSPNQTSHRLLICPATGSPAGGRDYP